MLKRFSPYLLWAILALPAAGILLEFGTSNDPRVAHILLHPTGEFAARFLIIAMMASPLALLEIHRIWWNLNRCRAVPV